MRVDFMIKYVLNKIKELKNEKYIIKHPSERDALEYLVKRDMIRNTSPIGRDFTISTSYEIILKNINKGLLK